LGRVLTLHAVVLRRWIMRPSVQIRARPRRPHKGRDQIAPPKSLACSATNTRTKQLRSGHGVSPITWAALPNVHVAQLPLVPTYSGIAPGSKLVPLGLRWTKSPCGRLGRFFDEAQLGPAPHRGTRASPGTCRVVGPTSCWRRLGDPGTSTDDGPASLGFVGGGDSLRGRSNCYRPVGHARLPQSCPAMSFRVPA